MLGGDLRALSFDRVIFGSDYPVFDPIRGRAALTGKAGLPAEEVYRITRGPAQPIFHRVRR